MNTNGNLIWKPGIYFENISVEDYFNSSFVKKYWIIPDEMPGENIEESVIWVIRLLKDMYKAGVHVSDIKEKAAEQMDIGYSIIECLIAECDKERR